jgi:hypothetical protein
MGRGVTGTGAETTAATGSAAGGGGSAGATAANTIAGAGASVTGAGAAGVGAAGAAGVGAAGADAAGAGAGGAGAAGCGWGTGAVGAAARGGSRPSGSTYPWGSVDLRMPSCTSGTSPTPGSPTAPTTSPSATTASFLAEIAPRCVSVTDQPSAVSIVTDLPLPGTVPANETTPALGARTASPGLPPRSMPRCWPAAYGFAGSNVNGCSTWPSVGQVHACAAGTAASAANSTIRSRRMANLVVGLENVCSSTVETKRRVVKKGYKVVTENHGRDRCEKRPSIATRPPRPLCAAFPPQPARPPPRHLPPLRAAPTRPARARS